MLLQQQEPYLQELRENSWTAKKESILSHFMCSSQKKIDCKYETGLWFDTLKT